MRAILYRNLHLLRHSRALPIVIALWLLPSALAILMHAASRSTATTAIDACLMIPVATLAPTLMQETVRGDVEDGTDVTVHCSVIGAGPYLAGQILTVLAPAATAYPPIVLIAGIPGPGVMADASALSIAALAGIAAVAAVGTITGGNGIASILAGMAPPAIAIMLRRMAPDVPSWAVVMPALAATAISMAAITVAARHRHAHTLRPSAGRPQDTVTEPAPHEGAAMCGSDIIAVSVRNVTFGYSRHVTVLDHINLDIPQGQSLAILGSNGVGKTTLFRIITGMLRPDEGEAVIDADAVGDMRGVFMLADGDGLSSSLTIRENIVFRSMLFGSSGSPNRIKSGRLEQEPLVRAFGLADHLDDRVSELSSGMRRRAGIAAGMLFKPRLIMLDEPTNMVDPGTRDLLIEMIGQLGEAGCTVLTITHDLDYCWRTADRVIRLDHGTVTLDRRLDEFADYDAFRSSVDADGSPDTHHVDFGFGRP